MLTKEEIKELKEVLPEDGIAMIHNLSGVSRPTVYRFFEGKKVRTDSLKKIWKAGWQVVKEQKEAREELLKQAQDIKESIC